ncbi:transmembrane protein 272 isoform X2 [Bombina bombina]|uniref:transmembrane protein 272 isoform X2 n=1 Tax=Bombina bombina TaxID=8345 RepID=UPI00235AA4AC|nr:transmembrane protein 272 isoform X2 [Bombina bombina]
MQGVTLKSILTVINIVNIVIGAVYIGQCTGQPLIPYYLIIWGSGSLLLLCLTCLPCGDGREPPRTSLATLCAQGLLLLCLFSFFIAGNVWIYSLFPEPWNIPSTSKWCHRVLYLYAFWITTVCHICIAIMLFSILCIFICFCILKASLPFGSRRDRWPN